MTQLYTGARHGWYWMKETRGRKKVSLDNIFHTGWRIVGINFGSLCRCWWSEFGCWWWRLRWRPPCFSFWTWKPCPSVHIPG
jgi:hypothetical protein